MIKIAHRLTRFTMLKPPLRFLDTVHSILDAVNVPHSIRGKYDALMERRVQDFNGNVGLRADQILLMVFVVAPKVT